MVPQPAFFSYSREDSDFAFRLAGDLKAAGASVWLDQLDIIPGQRWDRAVEAALANCMRMLVILSPASVNSINVMDEVSFALEEEKTVIPVIHKDCTIPFRLRRVQYVDFRHDYARGLKELVRTLAAGQTTPISDVPSQRQADVTEMDKHERAAEGERRVAATPQADFTVSASRQVLIKSHISPTHMFSGLRAARFEQNDLLALGNAMTSEELEPKTEAPILTIDPEENSGITAGYTYLGLFIDHDLTFSEDGGIGRHGFVADLAGTAAFDLSCIYGKGPAKQPYLYSSNGLRMGLGGQLTGAARDPNARQVPRINAESGGPARALIADPRNDENLIISQLHAAMLRFHNRVADVLRTDSLEEIQQVVRFHYQWVVLYDFLPTIIGLETLQSILPHMTARHCSVLEKPPRLNFYKPDADMGIPVEFSAAAYRFGHSMIRPTYRLNSKTEALPLIPFPPRMESLCGFRNIPSNLGIDWRLFFQMSNDSPKIGPERVQPSYKIDTSLLNVLGHLPFSGVATELPSLAARNLLRGLELKLPSGQAAARMMGIPPIADHDLRVGSATEAARLHNKPIVEFSPRFANNAPLWFYILAEAQQQFRDDNTPIRLGAVGGRIVGEVLVGVMYRDKHSFLNVNPSFRPYPQLCSTSGEFRMADLLMQAMQA
jgi:hypothetical protein